MNIDRACRQNNMARVPCLLIYAPYQSQTVWLTVILSSRLADNLILTSTRTEHHVSLVFLFGRSTNGNDCMYCLCVHQDARCVEECIRGARSNTKQQKNAAWFTIVFLMLFLVRVEMMTKRGTFHDRRPCSVDPVHFLWKLSRKTPPNWTDARPWCPKSKESTNQN